MVEEDRRLDLREILNEKQIQDILKQSVGEVLYTLTASEIKPAVDGIAGFLGEHFKAVLHIDVEDKKRKVNLFIKRIPAFNDVKAENIKECNFFMREHLMFQLMEEICINGSNSWYVKPYIYTESMFVMPDLSVEGYTNNTSIETLNLEHVLVTTSSLARFHAAFVNYETYKSIELKRPYNTLQEFGHLLTEGNLHDSPWLAAGSKLSANLLKEFSMKSYRSLHNLESKLAKLYVKACNTLTEYKDTVNVLLHKDLQVNNIMFKHENDVPVNAVFVDYQCLRYAPPAFDLMIFLYYTTDKCFRDEKERDIFDYYHSVFDKNVNDDSIRRLEGLGYDKEDFLKWCERARMFAMVAAMAVYPFALMDAKTAQQAFDNPDTYEKHVNEDRSEPVLAHANRCEAYKRRNLAITEEFVETHLLNKY